MYSGTDDEMICALPAGHDGWCMTARDIAIGAGVPEALANATAYDIASVIAKQTDDEIMGIIQRE